MPLQVAEGVTSAGLGGSAYEAALYGMLSGNIKRVVPVVSSKWEDICWAYLRCWLECHLDKALKFTSVKNMVSYHVSHVSGSWCSALFGSV